MSQRNLSAVIKIPKSLKTKLQNKKINKIFNNFEKLLDLNQNFAVGVSGGPDSLALAFLAKIYSIKKHLKVKFFIVNHKLRRNSTAEAQYIKRLLKKFSINSEILTWHGKKPKSNIQSLARKKRFNLLISRCEKLKINHILFAHHQGDLFENFFIRILRGSGLKGLISFDKKTKIKNINILRPLLDKKKEDLVYISKNVFGFYADDSSNHDDKFQRVRVRRLLMNLEKEGLDNKKFIKTIKNLKYSDEVIQFYVNKNLQRNSIFLHNRNELIINEEFFNQPYEVVFRSFSRLLLTVGKNYYPVRGKKIDNLIQKINRKSSLKTTLGGCVIKKLSQTVIISKEH